MLSAPAPPSIVSLPPKPLIVSSLEVPRSESLPAVPLMVAIEASDKDEFAGAELGGVDIDELRQILEFDGADDGVARGRVRAVALRDHEFCEGQAAVQADGVGAIGIVERVGTCGAIDELHRS